MNKVFGVVIGIILLAAGAVVLVNYLSSPIVQIGTDGQVKAVCTADGKIHTPGYLKVYKGGYTTEPVDRWYKPTFTANP